MRRLIGLVSMSLVVVPAALWIGSLDRTPPAGLYLSCAVALTAFFLALEGLFPRRHRPIGIILSALAALAAGLLMPYGVNNLMFVLPMLAYAVMVVGTARLLSERVMTFQQLALGAAVYVVAYVLSFLTGTGDIRPALSLWCPIYLIFAAVLLNGVSTQDAAAQSGAKALWLGNIALTVGFLIVAALLVNIVAIKDMVMGLIAGVVSALLWLSNLLGGGMAGQMEGGPLPQQQMPLLDQGEPMPAWLDALFTALFTAVAIAVLLALILGVVVALARLVRRLCRWLKQWMITGEQGQGDYHEEQFSLMNWKQVPVNMLQGVGKAVKRLTYRPPRWDSLDNRQKVRYAMEYLLFRGGRRVPDRALTAKEHMAAPVLRPKGDRMAFAEAYDRARYSDEPITPKDADNAREVM